MMVQQSGTRLDSLKRWGPLTLVVALVFLAFFMGWHEQVSLENIIRHRIKMHEYVVENFSLSIAIYICIYVAATALSFPAASLITITGGLVFGSVIATLLTDIGATIGATLLFLAVRTSFGNFLSVRAGPFLARLSNGFKENAFSYLLFLRLVPAFPFWLVNVAPAFFNVPMKTYFTATALGILPGTFAFALLGEGLDSVIHAQEIANPGCADAGTCEVDLTATITPQIMTAIAALIIVSLIPIVLKKLRPQPDL